MAQRQRTHTTAHFLPAYFILRLMTTLSLLLSTLLECIHFLIDLLLPRSISAALLPTQDHFAFHPRAHFEGYYTRVLTPDGATLVIIFCSVPSAAHRPHFVHFSYIPKEGDGAPLTRNVFPETIDWCPKEDESFELVSPNLAHYSVRPPTQSYSLTLPSALSVHLSLPTRTPLDPSNRLTKFARLASVLPLHWHIFSTSSEARYVVSQDGREILSGTGVAHTEKNWGASFPSGWTWSQAFSATRATSFALAGGKILGLKAYMLVYRSPRLQWSFAPPWTVLFLGRGLTIDERLDGERGALDLVVQDWHRKLAISIRSTQPQSDWLPLPCPLRTGHAVIAHETFSATMALRAYARKSVFGAWEVVEEETFEDVSFELGGDYRAGGGVVGNRCGMNGHGHAKEKEG